MKLTVPQKIKQNKTKTDLRTSGERKDKKRKKTKQKNQQKSGKWSNTSSQQEN